jgi:SMI1/KNR4 family protein SUKH-1
MDNETIKKWEAMLATLTVVQKSGLICSEAEIDQVEIELGFKFPAGYKEYCRIFGSGSLGQGDAPGFFRVYCPCPYPSSVDIRQTGHNLIGLKLDLDASEPLEDTEKAKVLHRLLEDGYAFGDNDRADRFIWDLTTYREDDRAYDIYWIPDECVEEVKLVGRDFFEFIDKFCLGAGLKIMFPEEDASDNLNAQERFFAAFEQYDENWSDDSFAESAMESNWKWLTGSGLFTEKSEVKLNCMYNAPGKEQADCLEQTWRREGGVEIEVTLPSDRPNIPRVVRITITVTVSRLTSDVFEGLFTKMVEIGEECGCSPSSFGISSGSEI